MKDEEATVPPAPMGQVDQGVRPAAWWRLSTLPECLPCVTVDPGEAQEWRDAGHAVVELGDVAAEREWCAKVCDLHSRLTWNDDRRAQSRVLAAEIRRGPNVL
jgi:hypothetical protein